MKIKDLPKVDRPREKLEKYGARKFIDMPNINARSSGIKKQYIFLDESGAVFKVFESGERRWYEMIKNKIGKIQDICNKKYYTRSNPL